MTDPLTYIKAKRASLHDLDDEDVDLLVREVEQLRAEVRLARAVIHALLWESSVIVTEQPKLRDALKAWGKADKVKLPPDSPPPPEGE